MIVYRGPQLVQFVNAYPNRRLAGSVVSARQASQVATSGEINANSPVSARLSRIAKPASPTGGISATTVSWIQASGGASDTIASTNRSTSGAGPSASATSPADELS